MMITGTYEKKVETILQKARELAEKFEDALIKGGGLRPEPLYERVHKVCKDALDQELTLLFGKAESPDRLVAKGQAEAIINLSVELYKKLWMEQRAWISALALLAAKKELDPVKRGRIYDRVYGELNKEVQKFYPDRNSVGWIYCNPIMDRMDMYVKGRICSQPQPPILLEVSKGVAGLLKV